MIRVPRPDILARIPAPHALLEASAGTGKTYTLEHLVVDLVLSGTPLPRILVVTFTDKATRELRARVRAKLESMTEPDAAPIEGEVYWELEPEALRRLREARADLDRAAISTIHGFCQRLFQASALEGRALFSQEQAERQRLFGRAFRDCLRGPFSEDPVLRTLLREALAGGWRVAKLERLLSEAQKERAEFFPKVEDARPFPRLEVDAAWAGLHAGTRKAALKQLEAAQAIEALGLSPFRRALAWKELKPESLVKAALKEGPEELRRFLAVLPTPEAALCDALLPPLQARLETLKAEEGLFDFDDMILRVKAALEGPGGEALAARLRADYDAVLIDEFQDTDAAQWEIFSRAFARPDKRLVLIGDPKQAIYGFRGGDLPTYRRAQAELGLEPLPLTRNFRSTKALVEACNLVFASDFFTGGNRYEHPVEAGRELGFSGAPLRLLRVEGARAGGALWRRAARGLAAELRALMDAGPRFGAPGAERALDWGDVFVLVGRLAEGRLVAEALHEAGVPSAFYRQRGLFGTPEAEAWLHLLQALEAPGDRARLARALLTPFFRYGIEDLEGLPAMAEDHPALGRLRGWARLARERRFGALVEAVLRESGVVEWLLLREPGARALTNLQHLGELLAGEASARHGDLGDLVRALKAWMEDEASAPEGQGSLQRLEGQARAVQILTLHAAKGLEAPVVAVFAPGQGRPSSLRRFHLDHRRCAFLGAVQDAAEAEGASVAELVQCEEDEEAQRLLYVALTRAQACLLLPCFVGAKGEPLRLSSAYRAANPRLCALMQSPPPGFEVVEAQELEPRALSSEAFEPAPLPELPPLDVEGLRAAARPFGTTSFTALQKRLDAERPEDPGDPEPDAPVDAPRGLPPGRGTGTLLHELLEVQPLDAVRETDFDSWWKGARAALLPRVQQAGLAPAWAEEVGRLVFLGLTTPLELGGSRAPLHAAEALLREMDFLSRFPGSEDFLEGSLDALFRAGGRAYVLDWKSNTLPDYGAEALAAFVRDHYEWQVCIYTLATLDFLGIEDEAAYARDFGGVLYVFLRGLPDVGQHFARPAWDEVRRWREELAALHGEAFHG